MARNMVSDLGIKTRKPIIRAEMAAHKTAAAARSFIFFMVSCFSGDMKSATFSIAELIISRTKTKPMAKTIAIHSIVEILKINPAKTASVAANK